jgi:hypothetical protein
MGVKNLDTAVFTVMVQGEYKAKDLHINWKYQFQNVPAQLQREIDAFWQKLRNSDLFRRGKLFNGRLARLDGFSIDKRCLSLTLSETDYKTLVYSNNNTEYIIRTWGDSFLSRALGVSAVVISVDHEIMFMKRSPFVGEFPNLYDVFGGHIEPDSYLDHRCPDVFAAISNELAQEVNLSTTDCEIICIGLIESTPNRKPELVFMVLSTLTSEEIKRHAKTAKDNDEYVSVHTVPNSQGTLATFMQTHKDQLTPSAYGCLWLHKRSISKHGFKGVRD